MRTPLLAASVLAVLAFSPWADGTAVAQDHSQHQAAAMPCCADHQAAAPAAMPCCGDHKAMAAKAAMPCCDDHKTMAMAMPCCDGNDAVVAAAGLGLPEKPVVQRLAVTFRDPVLVNGTLLFGRYVIEHDDARMARGEPCTYIFEAGKPTTPVVTFHCTHLDRPAPDSATVVLGPANQSGVRVLTEFQYAGDSAAHGAIR